MIRAKPRDSVAFLLYATERESLLKGLRFYVGITKNMETRLVQHNSHEPTVSIKERPPNAGSL